MKAITVKQPWASLIVTGLKPIENRTWNTNFRGRVLIHTSATPVKGLPCEILSPLQYAAVFSAGRLDALIAPCGAIIGSVEIVDCVIDHSSIWAEKTNLMRGDKPIYNWVLANPIEFNTPFYCKGKQSFWEFPDFLLDSSPLTLPF